MQTPFKFEDCTGLDEASSKIPEPVLIKKSLLDTEIARLASLSRPKNGRRLSRIVYPDAGAGRGLAPGTAVSISVLKPGEKTDPIRHNSSVINFCIAGGGHAVVNGKRIDFSQYDLFNVPSWSVYEYGNETEQLQVRLTYSNAPLLEKLLVHVVEESPEVPQASSNGHPSEEAAANTQSPFGTFKLTDDGAYLMPYEQLISPAVVEDVPLLWPWKKVKAELDKLRALGQSYVGRRLYLLFNPATGRTNGTTHNFFACITIRPKNIQDKKHRHISAAINYFFGGHGYSFVKGKRYEWSAGDLMLTAPGWAVHAHNSGDEDVYELTIQDSPLHISMGSLLWQEDLSQPIEALGSTGGFTTNREVEVS